MSRITQTLLARLAVELPAGVEPPSAVRLIPPGPFRAVDGRPEAVAAWQLRPERAAQLVVAAAARVSDRVIDFEHQTVLSRENGKPAPAAGWFKTLEWRGDDAALGGLWAVGVRWTQAAADMIRAGEYRYLSPVFAWDKATGDVLAVAHAGLTNNPGLDGLTDLSALAAAFDLGDLPQMNELLKKLLAAIGLAEGTTEEVALTAVAALKTAADKVVPLETEVTALKAAQPDPARYVPVATMTALQTELAALRQADTSRQVEAVVVAALAAGKLLPPQEQWARDLGQRDLAALKQFVATAPGVDALKGTQTGGGTPAGSTGQSGLSPDELAVCRATGIAPDAFVAARA